MPKYPQEDTVSFTFLVKDMMALTNVPLVNGAFTEKSSNNSNKTYTAIMMTIAAPIICGAFFRSNANRELDFANSIA